MIDLFINVIYEEGRQAVKDTVLMDLHQFLDGATKSQFPHVSVMAFHNLILLENIKK